MTLNIIVAACRAVCDNPITVQAILNQIATGWHGDPYALMAWRQEQIAKVAGKIRIDSGYGNDQHGAGVYVPKVEG